MRLIDADALLVHATIRQKAIDEVEEVTWYHQNHHGHMVSGAATESEAWYRPEDIYGALENIQPKKGKWMETTSEDPCYYYCSECKRQVDVKERFCPSCGAEMDGGDE